MKYKSTNFIFFSHFHCITTVYFSSIVFYNLNMSNLSNDIVSAIRQLADDKLLFFFAQNIKT